MEELNGIGKHAHKMMLNSRKTCAITGVLDVLSFDVNEVLLETDLGMLMIRGKDLHINRLTLEKGEVDVEGTIDSLTYSETTGYGEKAEGLFSKLFR